MPSVLHDAFDTYILALRQTPLDQHTEMTGRGALEALLNRFKPVRAIVTHEPKRAQAKGAPDFKVAQAGQVLGYVENKGVGENLDAVLKSDQIRKYQALSGNIVVTDYLRWVWLKDGKVVADERLGEARLLEDRNARLRPERVSEVQKLIEGFFSQPVTGISRAKPLAEALAVRSQLLRDFLGAELVRQRKADEGGQLIGLFGAFKKQVSHEITLAEFADAFAQTLAYGLFLAKLNDAANKEITLANAKTFIPQSVGLIRELVGFLDNLDRPEYADIAWVVEEVLSIINGIKLTELQEDLSFRNRRARRGTRAGSEEEWRLFSRDPFIYFYEDYLAKYDSKLRKSRGVYYTPPPVVNFIARAIHDILKDSFAIPAGLADRNRVTVLDFACGTGTFLIEVLERIFEEIGPDSGKAKQIVSDHILKNIFGFEYLIAPYTIAHLKLGQYLADKGHKLADDQRLQVYLTNTLEPIEPERNYLVPELSHETELAQEVKEKPILVITGNPPYSGVSRNMGPAASALIEPYKFVDGKHFAERKHWLHDDYVKFIAFAEKKMRHVEQGIVGVITNHGFLDNPTHRGFRASLLKSFDQIYVFDLHGSLKRDDRCPDGAKDENVFDIEPGVAVTVLVKHPDLKRGVWRGDLWGTRISKYEFLAHSDLRRVTDKKINPMSPYYLFDDRDLSDIEYLSGWKVTDIFGENSTAVQTSRDRLVVDFSESALVSKLKTVADPLADEDELRVRFFREQTATSKYKRGDGRGWSFSQAREWLRSNFATATDSIVRFSYRPFDIRQFVDRAELVEWPRPDVMRHMSYDNIAINLPRQLKKTGFRHVLVSDAKSDMCYFSAATKEAANAFPLYVYPPEEGARRSAAMRDLFGDGHDPFAGKERIENFAPDFREWIDARYAKSYSPEGILGYIYAVLHSSSYRNRYADFLRTDFPRIPFPEAKEDFELLSRLGWELVQTHLMNSVPDRGVGAYRGKGDDRIEKPRHSPAEQAIWINDKNYFADVPQAVWDFTIGGYQVIDKYLKSRKGRILSLDEIENVENVVNILDFTIEQMVKIDEAYSRAFPEGD